VDRAGLDILHEDDVLLIAARDFAGAARSGSVLLSFTGIGHAMGGIDVQRPEFFASGRRFDSVIFVTDKRRSWGNAVDFALVERVIAGRIAGKRLFAIGNSMGGFLAILASRHLPIEAVVAFCPQYSVRAEDAPWEDRWAEYRDAIGDWRVPNLDGCFGEDVRYCIFSGGAGLDGRQARLFPVRRNIDHVLAPAWGHNVAKFLKAQGKLAQAIEAGFVGGDVMAMVPGLVRLSPR
jgi:pimeloyl-ACP methyl ester carboxylesterase